MSAASSPLKQQLVEAMKAVMKAGDKERLGAIRLILAAVKQVEVDECKALADEDVLSILDTLCKRFRESIKQYENAGRSDLAEKERRELAVAQGFLPRQFSDEEVAELIQQAIREAGAESVRDMGKVIKILKPTLRGRADMGKVSGQIRSRLGR